jgi:uncharacterized protein (TIGR04141 family)
LLHQQTPDVHVTDADHADRTHEVSIYRLEPGHDLESYWGVLDEEAAADYASDPVEGLGDQALLVFGERPPHPRAWVEHVRSLTGLDLGYLSSDAAALLIVRTGRETFALTFGISGRRLLRTHLVDREFGLDLALRVLDADAVRQVRRQYLSANARVDTNLVPAGQELWSFGIREHAELVRQLAGAISSKARMDLSHSRRSRRRTDNVPIDCTDRMRLPLPESPQLLAADLREIARVLHEQEIDPSLAPLRWVRRVPPDRTDVTDRAWEITLDMLASFDDTVSLAYPGRFHGGPDVRRYVGHIGRHRIDGPQLALADLRDGLTSVDRARRLRVLQTSRIGGLDSSGDPLATDAPAVEWLSAQVDIDRDQRLVLLDGEWYDTSDGYVEHVARVVGTAFANRPAWDLPAWTDARRADGRLEEQDYNHHVGEKVDGFICLDRKLVRTRAHRRGFEACDLLGPDGELVHVKKISSRTGSGPLSHLFAQGIVAIDSLTDRETWHRFVDLVREQHPSRADELGTRPHTLVFAIHRSDGPLTPERLFTFARSELASAAILFQRLGVRLQVCVIP